MIYLWLSKTGSTLFYHLSTLMRYATILMQPVCKFLSVGVLCSKERRDQFGFMRWTASGIFTDVRLYGRDGGSTELAEVLRAVPRIIWLRDKGKNGTAWKPSLPKLNDGSSASFDPIPNAALLAPFYLGRRNFSDIWLRLRRVRIVQALRFPLIALQKPNKWRIQHILLSVRTIV